MIGIQNSLDGFCTWLAATSLSQTIQTVEWIIPAVQTVHILCVAGVITSALVVDLRFLGVGFAGLSPASIAARFLPVIWWLLPVLLATGLVLIVAEPTRALENPVFLLKMGLIIAVVGLTVVSQNPRRRDATSLDRPGSRRWTAIVALMSLPLWVGIIFAGRWIAYVRVR